jgi:hypothetical protein
MASLMFDDNGAIRFRSRSNQYYKEQTAATLTTMMPGFASAIPADKARFVAWIGLYFLLSVF